MLFHKRMTLDEKRKYIIDNQIELNCFGISFVPKSELDLNCKFCNKKLKIVYSDKTNDFKIKGCICLGTGNRLYFNTIFGEDSDELYKNTLDFMRKEKAKGRFTKEWFLNKYGDNGNKKYLEFLAYSRQDEKSFVARYGDVDGKIKYNDFLSRSKLSLKNFIKRYGEEDGNRRWDEYLASLKSASHFTLDYWINKCDGNCDKAKKIYSDHQSRGIDWHIDQYGEILGKKKYKEKCKMHSWSNSKERYIEEFGVDIGLKKFRQIQRKRQSNRKFAMTSGPAKELFETIDSFLVKESSMWNDMNNIHKEFIVSSTDHVYFYDYVIPDLFFCIEFNGDYWHMNPNKYKEDYVNPTTKKMAKEVWENDKAKRKTIEKIGYFFLEVWEFDYKNNKNRVLDIIEKIIDERRRFIYG